MQKIGERIIKILSVACCIVAVFAAFCACQPVSENELGFQEKNAKNMVSFNLWIQTIGIDYSISVNHVILTGEKGSEFVCSTSTGDPEKEGLFVFFGQQYDYDMVASGTVASGTEIHWTPRAYIAGEPYRGAVAENETIWFEFINRKGTDILGYAVVRVDKIEGELYEPCVMKSVVFPKVNGNYQKITQEQVTELIKNIEKS